jgi:hypothetical protein
MSKMNRCSVHGTDFKKECHRCKEDRENPEPVDLGHIEKIQNVASYLESIQEAVSGASNIDLADQIQDLYDVLDILGKDSD